VRNQIVIVAPPGRATTLSLGTFRGRIAMGDPDHVPAGSYGKRALEVAGLWRHLASHVVPTSSVREALALAERGEVDLAVVYRTDAELSDRVVIAHRFRDDVRTPAVEYEIAMLRGGDAEVFTKLTNAEAMRGYVAMGFTAVPR
jgi:molybdate transport system substrate-binding protein